ncbi:MAG: AraC family transcriptional regulator [Christensenellaceae bacterium]|jgi:AraC-like DNA-binding protein
MQLHSIAVGSDLRETTPHGSPMFPLEAFDLDYDRIISGDIPWHWHNEVELQFVYSGSLWFHTHKRRVLLSEGDGMLFNADVLHAMIPERPRHCKMFTVVFKPEILFGTPHSLLEQKYVLPILNTKGLEGIPLKQSIPWQNKIIKDIRAVHALFVGKPFGFELMIQNRLSDLWITLIHGMRDAIPVETEPKDHTRIKELLMFLNKHYAEDICIADISAATGIGEREIFRCFKTDLETTPFSYLTDIRVRTAADMLITTNLAVTDICFSVGFSSTSYFSKVFKVQTGLTPREYRTTKKRLLE